MYPKLLVLFLGISIAFSTHAQQPLPLTDLSAFKSPHPNWRIVGDATADLAVENKLTTTPGTGVLACIHEKGKYGLEYDLFTKDEFGDVDVDFEFMLAKGSNSGVYLQGRYEIQLYDSWGKKTAKYNDVGGIYERWNDAMPEGQKGYEGYAPRTNAAKAPGLWQHMTISFQAPRFDANGKKIQNAKILKITLNGAVLHENVELSGPTRGAIKDNEVLLGPLRIQGDHGSVAFRNIAITNYNQPPATLTDIRYNAYYGSWPENVDLTTLEVNDRGKIDALTWEVSKERNNYILDYKGKLNALTTGKYVLSYQMSGNTLLILDGNPITKNNWYDARQPVAVPIDLTAGTHSLEIINNKRDGWLKPTIGLWISGPGFRDMPLHNFSSLLSSKASDPILVSAEIPTTLRSFMDFKKLPADDNYRVVHAISVGSPTGLHYTYDLDKANIVQVWRGDFLDASPMWESRGDGSSRPREKALPLSVEFSVNKNPSANWQTDTTGSGYRPLGYTMIESGVPTFKFNAFGTSLTDEIRVKDGKYFERTISAQNAPSGLTVRVADGRKVEDLGNGLYAIDDKNYYIKVNGKASVRNSNGKQELLLPFSGNKVTYELMF